MNYFSSDESIPKLLRECARNNAGHIFCRSGDWALTYAQLNERVNRLANGLAVSGVAAGDRVAGCSPTISTMPRLSLPSQNWAQFRCQ